MVTTSRTVPAPKNTPLSRPDKKDCTSPEDCLTGKLHHVMWRMNQRCNYKCAYCFREGIDEARWQEHANCGQHAPSHISSCFNNTGKRWRIHMTGGEPLLYPRFVELASRLADRHQLSINTNLSTDCVHDFAACVPVPGVYVINATAHIQEQEKRGDSLRRFVDRAVFLQSHGFRVRIMYIAYPPLLNRMTADLKMFAAAGISECGVKIFRGCHDSKSYPGDYTPEQKAFVRSHPLSLKEQAILDGKNSFHGHRCIAGHRAFYMDIHGNLTRCCTLPTAYGNLFQQDYRFDESPGLCPARECVCPYQGLKFAEKQRSPLGSIARLTGRARKKATRAVKALFGN